MKTGSRVQTIPRALLFSHRVVFAVSVFYPFQVNVQFTRERHIPNSTEREDIKKLFKCMLDIPWAGKHGDHSTLCEMCNTTSIWFKLAHMLLETVFPEGDTLARDDTLGSVAIARLSRTSSSGKAVSNRSLCKSTRAKIFHLSER